MATRKEFPRKPSGNTEINPKTLEWPLSIVV